MGEAGYSITIVQIYNALRRVGHQEGVFRQRRALCCPCSPGCHLTHAWLIQSVGQHTCTFLLNMSCFECIILPPPPPLPRREARQHVGCLKVRYLATIMAMIPAFHMSILEPVRHMLVWWNIINIITRPLMRKKRRKRRRGHHVHRLDKQTVS